MFPRGLDEALIGVVGLAKESSSVDQRWKALLRVMQLIESSQCLFSSLIYKSPHRHPVHAHALPTNICFVRPYSPGYF